MKIAHINTLAEGSTGKIMFGVADEARKAGHIAYTFSSKVYRRSGKRVYIEIANHTYYGSEVSNFIHKVCGQLTGFNGFFSIGATIRVIRKLQKEKVELIHLHNLHEFCINLPILFGYIKRHKIKVVWTLHDCWSFTGHCPHYTLAKCNDWKTGCKNCPQLEAYPRAILDSTGLNWKVKRLIFCSLPYMTIVTPSQWLANQVKDSFLASFPVRVINNGIDFQTFCYCESDFRSRNNLGTKIVILGVAYDWGVRKGIDVFIWLANRLDKCKYQIILVGTDEQIEKQLPDCIIAIRRTQNVKELAEIYSAADVFVNPTREEVLGMVNIEALACGTPVITFRTGGSPEIIDQTCGSVVECDDVDGLEQEIIRVCKDKPYSQEACIKRARQFDQKEKFKEYVKLYEDKMRNK